jgi:hypothetical protein
MRECVLWLKITRLCREFHVLPEPGGLLQQQKRTVMRLEAVLNAMSRVEELELTRARNNK